MNTWNGSGFITREPDYKTLTTKNGETMKLANFCIACQRKGKDAGADYINCTAFGKTAEFLEKYFGQGKGIEVRGHIQTGSYEGKNGKVYTTDIICDEIEFPKSKRSEESSNNDTHHSEPTPAPKSAPEDNFMNIPDNIADSLPFK